MMRLIRLKKRRCWLWFGLLMPVTIAFADASRLPVSVSIAPQAYFVKKIGGDLVSVKELVPSVISRMPMG